MKKIFLLTFLLAVSAVAGRAQESRQDVSISGSVLIQPYVEGSTGTNVSASRSLGVLASYRYMLTPSSALEVNYGITQNKIHYDITSGNLNVNVNTRTQEISGGYVRYFHFRNWNPFAEAGAAGLIWMPIRNIGTQTLDAKQQTTVGAYYGAGFAYEISPSFDIRVEYRGLISKVPSFGGGSGTGLNKPFNSDRYYNIYDPVVGVAYHF